MAKKLNHPSILFNMIRFTVRAIVLYLLLAASSTETIAEEPLSVARSYGRLTLSNSTKLPYYRTASPSNKNPQIELAILVIHGRGRNADDYIGYVVQAVKLADIKQKTLVLAPQFQTEEDKPKADESYWSGRWNQGDRCQNKPRISSFAVVDEIFQRLADRKKFPKLQRIVLAGHSGGGQFVQRYAGGGKAIAADGVKVRFLVMNPSSYLYLDDRRVNAKGNIHRPTSVKRYNEYKYGLENLNHYMRAVGQKAIQANMTRREVYYVGGTEDTGTKNLDTRARAMPQGANRIARFRNYRQYVSLFPKWKMHAHFVEVVGVGHSGKQMFHSEEAEDVLFGDLSEAK